MALSARRFIHENTCPEPTNQINCNYHATDVNSLCDGTASTVAIFSNTATLTDIYNNTITDNNIGEGGVCAEGMDVVFLIDYTGSMSGGISGVKTGISNLVSTINTESGGDYRLSLVVYDERNSTSPAYSSSGYYQNLPSSQKINTSSPDQSGYNLFFTCVEKMNTVGNSTSFTNALNAIDGVNSSTEMSLGSGNDSDEPAGRCIYEIVANGFAGSFRNGVQKLIILITDNITSESNSYWQNTLTPALNNIGAQLLVQVDPYSSSVNSSSMAGSYTYAVENTQPQGYYDYGLNFNSTWTTGLQTAISDLCTETFVYTCDALPVGWYQETGSLGNTAYYWDGSDWTSTHTCQYTVTINLVNLSPTTTIDNIDSNHAYYTDANTYTITADYGTSFTLTNSVTAIADHTFDDITSTSTVIVSGSGGTISVATDGLLASNEFQITGTVTTDMEFNVLVNGTANETEYGFELNIIGDETDGGGYSQGDTLDANSQTQSPAGYVRVSPAVPASGWVDVGSTYYRSARRYTFTGVVGSTHSFDVNLTPDPTDYDLTLNSVTKTTSNTAINNGLNYTLSNANKDLTGTFTMPSGGGSAELFVLGQVNQPDYTFRLTATESITGASIDGAPYSQTFTGYTGDTFDFTIQLSENTDYDSFEITGVTKSGNDTLAVTYSIDNTNGRVTGTVTMPQGGGDCALAIAGTAEQSRHTYTITFVDPYTDSAKWQQITYTGLTGSFHATTHPLLFQDEDTTYYVDGVTNDDTSNLVSNRNHATDNTVTDLNIVLASMPQGGGSATVTVTGSQAPKTYTFNTIFSFSPNSLPASNFTSTDSVSNLSIPTTAAAGTTHTIQTYIETPTDYEWASTPGVSESSSSLSSPTCSIQSGTGSTSALVSVTLTMPSGGGSGTVTIAPTVREKSYTYTLTVQTNGSSSSANQYSEALATAQGDVSGSNNDNGTVTITYGPMNAGDSVDRVMVGVIANNATDYTPEITGFGYSTGLAASLTPTENTYGSGSEGMALDFTMHSQDPRGSGLSSGTLTANVSLTAKDHTFTINFADTIANVQPNSTSQVFTGPVGEEWDWTQSYYASTNYTFNISSVSDNSGSVTSTVIPGGQGVSGTLTMPSGGGSATVTAAGTSTLTQYNYIITWDNNISGADWLVNNADLYEQTLTMTPGTTQNISQQLDPDSSREITSLTVSDNSSDVTITSYSADSGIIQARVTMPSNATGNRAATITTEGSTTVITKTLTINYSESITGARITSSTNELAAERTTEDVSGGPGTTGSLTRYLMASQPLYTNPVINTITDNSSYITNLASASSTGGSGLYREFTFDYQIPLSDQSGTITIGGSVTVDEDCYVYTASSLSNYSWQCNTVRYWPCGSAASTTTSPIGGGQSCGGSGYTSTSRTFCHSVTRASMDSSFPGDQPYWQSGGGNPGDSISKGNTCSGGI